MKQNCLILVHGFEKKYACLINHTHLCKSFSRQSPAISGKMKQVFQLVYDKEMYQFL